MFGDEEAHSYVRVMAACEMLSHRGHYDNTSPSFIINDDRILTSDDDSVIGDVMTDGRYMELIYVTQVMRDELQWIPIHQRIEYKLCLTVFKALHGISPGYIAAICVPVSSLVLRSRLPSADLGKLSFIRTNTEFGKRAFAHAGPTARNNIPTAVKLYSTVSAFRLALKTYLF